MRLPSLSFVKKAPPASGKKEDSTLPIDQDLVRAGALLARERNFKDLVSVFVEQAQDISRADLSAFYIFKDPADRKSDLKLVLKRGRHPVPETISGDKELIGFLRECREALVFNNKQTEPAQNTARNAVPNFLKEALINPEMKSGMALPLVSPPREIGVLFVASQTPCFFSRQRFYFLDCYAKLEIGRAHV